MLTNSHPATTQVTIRLPKDLLHELGHLALDLDCHRSEAIEQLLTEALAARRTKKQMEG